jgi:hypothetical protein
MTVATTVLGLLPIMLSSGSGMDITQPIATPTFGGMISSTIYVLFLIPCLFAIGDDLRRRRPEQSGRAPARAVTVLILCLTTASLMACGDPRSSSRQGSQAGETKPGEWTLDFTTTPSPPSAGDNTVMVSVRQPDGAPVTDAAVKVVLSMPAMPSMNMPAMRTESALQHSGAGQYRGDVRLSMGGTWNVSITATRGDEVLATKRQSIVARN